jgi:predicted permease
MRRSPGFALTAILTLALGIGANTMIYSLVSAVLLRPPAGVREPSRLVAVYTSDYSGPRYGTSSYADYQDFGTAGGALSGLAAYTVRPLALAANGKTSRVWSEEVSTNYFSVLGVSPALGRVFLPSDGGAPGTQPYVVLSHAFWQRAFGSDPGVIGRAVRLNGHDFTVVGVASTEFGGLLRGVQADVWVPLLMQGALDSGNRDLTDRGSRSLFMMGRLAPGATLAEAQAGLHVIARRLHEAYPQQWTNVHDEPRTVTVIPERDARIFPALRGTVVGFLGLLMAVVALVLLICCANIANLLLTRAAGRQREIAIRLALGANRGRLVRQLLTESVVLAALGAAAGTVLAAWAVGLLTAFKPPLPVPVTLDLRIDRGVLAFTIALAAITGLAFGLAPALRAARANVIPALKGGALTERTRGHGWTLRNVLVVGQVAVSLVLLTLAGLFVRSLQRAQSAPLGFDSRHVALFSFELGNQAYTEARGKALYEEMTRRVASLPGVRGVTLAKTIPLGLAHERRGVRVEGHAALPGEDLEFGANTVGPGYFSLMKIPIVRGREFTEHDRSNAPPVVIVNETFARRFWPGENPIGRHLTTGGGPMEVIGVAHDATYHSLTEEPLPYFYVPFLQQYTPDMTLEVRTTGDPAAIIPTVRRVIAALNPDLVIQTSTMDASLGLSLLPQRVGATLLGIFGLLGLALAGVGLYGVVAYTVSRRTRELGIRVALGAERRDVHRLVIRHGMALAGTGLVLGLGAALGVTRLVQGFLFGVSATDPLTLGGVAAFLASVALLASYIPARRATSIDPVIALRDE